MADHTTPLFKKLNILKLEDIYKFHIIIHTHKAILKDEFKTSHGVNIRNKKCSVPNYHRLTLKQTCCIFNTSFFLESVVYRIKGT